MDELLNAKKTAKLLVISVPYTYKLAYSRKLPSVMWNCIDETGKQKRVIRFELDQIKRFIETHRVT